jgi:hypothetical protein
MINSTPSTGIAENPSSVACIRHRDSHQGTKPAIVPGATNKKQTVPKMAYARIINFTKGSLSIAEQIGGGLMPGP